ncbi:hypothetical protein HYW21_01605 [Candidatus Woesearchaeota archaeon]|nr:hypothetical protein [Candidatus Woesearchaeota archaeon]
MQRYDARIRTSLGLILGSVGVLGLASTLSPSTTSQEPLNLFINDTAHVRYTPRDLSLSNLSSRITLQVRTFIDGKPFGDLTSRESPPGLVYSNKVWYNGTYVVPQLQDLLARAGILGIDTENAVSSGHVSGYIHDAARQGTVTVQYHIDPQNIASESDEGDNLRMIALPSERLEELLRLYQGEANLRIDRERRKQKRERPFETVG